jgi:hypothetical protein
MRISSTWKAELLGAYRSALRLDVKRRYDYGPSEVGGWLATTAGLETDTIVLWRRDKRNQWTPQGVPYHVSTGLVADPHIVHADGVVKVYHTRGNQQGQDNQVHVVSFDPKTKTWGESTRVSHFSNQDPTSYGQGQPSGLRVSSGIKLTWTQVLSSGPVTSGRLDLAGRNDDGASKDFFTVRDDTSGTVYSLVTSPNAMAIRRYRYSEGGRPTLTRDYDNEIVGLDGLRGWRVSPTLNTPGHQNIDGASVVRFADGTVPRDFWIWRTTGILTDPATWGCIKHRSWVTL